MSSGCLEEARSLLGLVHCGAGASASAAHYPDIVVDLERAVPTETERDVYNLLEAALAEADLILTDLAGYKDGASAAIRAAIERPTDAAAQAGAWNALVPLVRRQRTYYRFALHVEKLVPVLLWELVSGPLPALEALEARQALAKELAGLLHFVLSFDALKMACPALQNDFSFYRRTLARRHLAATDDLDTKPTAEPVVSDDEAYIMSFFYAQASPMLERLKQAGRSFLDDHPQVPPAHTLDILATMGNVCRMMADSEEAVRRMSSEETLWKCLSVLTATCLLYDDLCPGGGGLAARASQVDPRLAVASLRRHGRLDLVATLQYQAKSLHPARAPAHLRNLFP